jgi:hypothetical protein
MYDAYLVFLNGLIIGVHTKPKQLVKKVYMYIYICICVYIHIMHIYICVYV